MADPAVQGRVTLSTDTFTPTRNLLNVSWRDKYRDALRKLCAEGLAPKTLISPELSAALKAHTGEQPITETNPVAAHPAVAKAFEQPEYGPNPGVNLHSTLGSLGSTAASIAANRFGFPRTASFLNWGGPVASGTAAGLMNPNVGQADTAGVNSYLTNIGLQQTADSAYERARSGNPEDVQAYREAEQKFRNDLRTSSPTEFSKGLDYRVDPRTMPAIQGLWNGETAAQLAAGIKPAELAAGGRLKGMLRSGALPFGISQAVGAAGQLYNTGELPSVEQFSRSILPEAAAQTAYGLSAPAASVAGAGSLAARLRGFTPAMLAANAVSAGFNLADYARMPEEQRQQMLRQESEEAISHPGAWSRFKQPFRFVGKTLAGDPTGAANLMEAREPESIDAARYDAANRNKHVRAPVEAGDNPDHPEFSDPRNRMYTPDDTKRWMSNVLTDLPDVPSKYVSTLVSSAFQDPKTLVHVSNVDGAVNRAVREAKQHGVVVPPERIDELRRLKQIEELQKPENSQALEGLEQKLQAYTGSKLTPKGMHDIVALSANIGIDGVSAAINNLVNNSLHRGLFLQKDLGWFEPQGRFAPYKEPPEYAKTRADAEAERKARDIYRATHPGGVRKLF